MKFKEIIKKYWAGDDEYEDDDEREADVLNAMSYSMQQWYSQQLLESIRCEPYMFTPESLIDRGEMMDYSPGWLEELLMLFGYRSRKYKESEERITLDNQAKAQWLVDNNFSCDYMGAIHMLQSTHSTTADEDFAEIDIEPLPNVNSALQYRTTKKRESYFEITITPTETRIYIPPQQNAVTVYLEENQIRKIATKKRGEMGWGECK